MAVDIPAVYAASPALAALRDELLHHYAAIDYEQSDDEDWESNVVGNLARVYYADDPNPACCLAHELLHLWLQANGYRRIRNGLSDFDETPWFGSFMTSLDNELQHHRVSQRFLDMGFDGQKFYGHSDAGIAAHLEAVLANPADNIRHIILGYFSLIAPGGRLTQVQKDAFRNRFHARRKGKYAPVLQQVDQAFAAWRAAGNLNAEDAVRGIMLSLRPGTLTWFAYSQPPDFPANGFFVGQHFVM